MIYYTMKELSGNIKEKLVTISHATCVHDLNLITICIGMKGLRTIHSKTVQSFYVAFWMALGRKKLRYLFIHTWL